MMQRTQHAPRGPRNGSSTGRAVASRGGIQKRRAAAGPVRVDKDGDLDMDAAAGTVGRGKSGKGRVASSVPTGSRGRGRPAGPSKGRPTQHNIERGMRHQNVNVRESHTANTATIQVDGLHNSKAASNSDGGLQSLEGFLERKASALDSASNRTVKIKKSYLKGDSVYITASLEDVEQMLKLDQFSFAGAVLSIKTSEPGSPRSRKEADKSSSNTQEIKEKLKAILAGRYNVEQKFLDLSRLEQDAGLLEMGLGSLDGKTTSKLFPAMMVVCDGLFENWAAKREAIVSVSLAGNSLANVTGVTSLAQTFPDVKNLDLSANSFSDMKGLEAWRWKFRGLENLVLTGNPIETQNPDCHVEIMKWYPKLLNLNGVQIRTPEQVAAAAETSNSPIPISGPDFRDVGNVGENFIRQFVPLYDSDRTSLLSAFYDDQSLFSLSINMKAPRDRTHSTPVPGWSAYIPHSRALNKITHLQARMNRQYRGRQNIQPVWSGLPATRHPDLTTKVDKFMIECHSVPGLADPSGQSIRGVDGLILMIHGEFEEEVKVGETGIRSFSRTFILGPGAPGGPALRVVSDMMALRAYSPLALPSQLANKQVANQQPINQQPVSQPQAPILSLEQQQQQQKEIITKQLVEQTGMTPEFAMLCLQETGGDLQAAFAAFTANRDKLPPNAFLANAGQGVM